ncbi:serine/threonine-protein phosphatase 6 regulatory ankyrin repeat subunit B-like [Polypterus senegalus]|uniref:serine/threonine-protein phosphatase 6 regulatory ankyrin repeat subunit B-like n=1 Tax=Polypterus senegalus TaxID=55291 RepID=UPI00196252A7|nr:serine/threonine-protein phosphatase 6 regulatory ankyrin repeat subunit B-like [Polypterus senegalus]
MASLKSRCINGSTLIHAAAYFGEKEIVKRLLELQTNVNLLDYKGATPLHRARDPETMKVLLDHGAEVNCRDADGNTPVHVICYGEAQKPTQLDCLKLLLSTGVKIEKSNNKGLLPIHCAVMQGRQDAIDLLLQCDIDGQLRRKLECMSKTDSPSLLYLAVANGHLTCADWLATRRFTFKPAEQEELLYELFQEDTAIQEKTKSLEFLIKSGTNINTVYEGGNSVLHLAALKSDLIEMLVILLKAGAEVNKCNNERHTPLFYAVQISNLHGADLLLRNVSRGLFGAKTAGHKNTKLET